MRALSLDPDLSDAHATLGHLKMQYEFDWAGAEQEFLQRDRARCRECQRALPARAAARIQRPVRRGAGRDGDRTPARATLGGGGGESGFPAGARGAIRGRRDRGAARDRDRPGTRARAQRARPRTARTRTLRRSARGVPRAARHPDQGLRRRGRRAGLRRSDRRGSPGARPTTGACRASVTCPHTTSQSSTRRSASRRRRSTGWTRPWRTARRWRRSAWIPPCGRCTPIPASRLSSGASACRMPPEPGSGSRPQVPSGARVQ